MEISALTSSASRLWEMLEKSGISPGAELRAPTGPAGEPPRDLVREFERAMEAPPAATEGGRMAPEAIAAEHAPPGLPPEPLSVAERVTDPSQVAGNDSFNWKAAPREEVGGRSSFRDRVSELSQLLEKAGGSQISPVELYRIQYLLGMLKVQSASAVKVSQQTGQGLESLLKQQG